MTLNGKYIIYYKHPHDPTRTTNFKSFCGECENFTSSLCAFSNDNNEMLIVRYEDIIQMRLVK